VRSCAKALLNSIDYFSTNYYGCAKLSQSAQVSKIVNIRLEMIGEEAEKFLRVKKARGVKHNAELIRILLHEAAIKEGC